MPFDRNAAVTYARRHALASNPKYRRYPNDCTNFISQCMLAGGWTMIGGSVFDRTSDGVWWYGKSVFSDASYTWGGAQHFANFLRSSRRGARVQVPGQLEPGDVLQMVRDSTGGNQHIGHTMIVTGKSATDLFLSYHSPDHLDEPLSAIMARSPLAAFVPWHISPLV